MRLKSPLKQMRQTISPFKPRHRISGRERAEHLLRTEIIVSKVARVHALEHQMGLIQENPSRLDITKHLSSKDLKLHGAQDLLDGLTGQGFVIPSPAPQPGVVGIQCLTQILLFRKAKQRN